MRELAGEDAPGLVIAFEYPQERMAGPPFSVGEDELRRFFAAVECLEDRPRQRNADDTAKGVQQVVYGR